MLLPFERIVVTGGAGFIGSNFIHHLLHTTGVVNAESCCPDHHAYASGNEGNTVIANLDALTYAADERNLHGIHGSPYHQFHRADICRSSTIAKIFNDFRPQAIIHFAAESHVDRSISDGEVFVRTNVLGTQVLLDAARRFDVQHFLHVSTDEVYGSTSAGAFSESDPLNPSSPYSASKASSDHLVLAHHKTYGLPVTVTRCTNNYGPRQHPEKLLPKMLLRAANSEKLPIYGTGLNVRDWLYVKDHCAALLMLLRQKASGQVFNIGADNELTNLEVVGKLLGLLDQPSSLVEFVPDRPGHDWRYALNSSKIRNLGWQPRVEFDTGLRYTSEWVLAPDTRRGIERRWH